MSKKDLLERISRAHPEPRVRRTETSTQQVQGDSVTTRVSRKVVRRRRRPGRKAAETAAPASAVGETPAPSPRVDATPKPAVAVEQAPPPEPVEAPAPTPEPEPAPDATPPQVEAAPPTEPTAPVVETAPEPAPEPVVDDPAPVVEAAPEPVPEPAVQAAPEPAPESAPQPAAPEPTEAKPEARQLPETPRFTGLGKAVVMPPPGYDPTNPTAYRRRIDQEAATTATTTGDKKAPRGRGRRRVEPGGTGRPDRQARRGRRGRKAAPMRGRGVRRKTRKKGTSSVPSTVAPKASKRKIRIDNVISVGQLAHELGVKAPVVIKQLIGMGMMVRVNEMLDLDTAALVASEFEYEVENVGFQEDKLLQHVAVDEEEEKLQPRPPVVTIMGHVDHGKTTLLDTIRDTRVAQGEAGGITQHIGAYQVVHEGSTITFVDTPGHAAFTEMRARGASITDIVVLVVAADDGVQPQTIEAISHSRAAGVPIIVAINKMDRPGMKAEPIMQRLAEFELIPEDWGGDTLMVPISALKGEGIEDILEAILLQAEMLDLSANPDRYAEGVVVESKMEQGRGAVATVLIQKGTLKTGNYLVIGTAYGKVRAMTDHTGKRIKMAGPSVPVELFGLSDLPETGDVLQVVETEKNARALAEHRQLRKREEALSRTRRRTAEDLFAAAASAQKETLNIIIKADVQGSLEAVRGALMGLEVEGTELRVLLAGVGNISESDVTLATSNNALLLGFNVRLDAKARQAADEYGVDVQLFNVIYTAMDYVKSRLSGMLEPEYEESRQGSAEVRAIFTISKVGTIAGCFVRDGKIGRNQRARLLRGNRQVWQGRIGGLKRFKDDVREVESGYECGISLDGFNDIEERDIIETYILEEVPID